MHIAVATDLSKGAVSAAVWGFDFARRMREAGRDVQLSVLHSVESRYPQIVDTAARLDDPGTRHKLEEEIRSWARTNFDRHDLDWDVESLQGPPHERIPDWVRDRDADWLAIGATGRGSLEKFVVGSTSESIAHSPPTTMTLCHQGYADWSDDPSLLVAVDFSDASTAAVECALDLAEAYGASLTFDHIVEPPTSGSLPHDPYEGTGLEDMGDLVEIARDELDTLLSSYRDRLEGLEYSQNVITGYPTRELVDRTEEGDHDAVVLGSAERSAFGDFLVGSVSRGVVKHLPSSVVLAPSDA